MPRNGGAASACGSLNLYIVICGGHHSKTQQANSANRAPWPPLSEAGGPESTGEDMKRLTAVLLVVFLATGCAEARMAGWGFVTTGVGLGVYSGVTIGVGVGKGGTVDEATLGAQLGVSAALALLGAVILLATPDADKEESQEELKPRSYQKNREAALRQAILRDQKKNQKRDQERDQKKSTEVTCNFLNSKKSQTCFSNQGHTCTGANSCSVKVSLPPGTELTWKSTCSGTVENSMGSKKIVASFTCGSPATDSTPTDAPPGKTSKEKEKKTKK